MRDAEVTDETEHGVDDVYILGIEKIDEGYAVNGSISGDDTRRVHRIQTDGRYLSMESGSAIEVKCEDYHVFVDDRGETVLNLLFQDGDRDE